VKDLEEKNIGRPSTYAPIIGTLLDRRYILREKKSLIPTDLGFVVTELMEKYFSEIVDADFTANLEDRLDDIEVKNIDWKEIVADFYGFFEKELKVAEDEIEKVVIEDELTGELCEKCGKPMARKQGRFGDFIACTGYPECKNTKQIVSTVDVQCPKCGKDIIVRRGKTGRVFYGCSGYPDCDQVFWNKPTSKKCPECNSVLLEKKTKNSNLACSNPECGYKE
jgi:DNA topoisomerase-1